MPPQTAPIAQYHDDPVRALDSLTEHRDCIELTGGDRPHWILAHPDSLELLFDEHDHLERHMVGARSVATRSVGSVHGDQWRAQRSVQQPHFSPERVREYHPDFFSQANQVVEEFLTVGTTDIRPILHRSAVETLLRTIIGLQEVDQELLDQASVLVEWQHAQASAGTISSDLEEAYQSFIAELISIIDAQIDRVHKHGEDRGIIPALLAAGETHSANYTRERIRDEALAKLFSAHRTSAQTWIGAFFELGNHPELQRRVRDTLRSTNGSLGDRLDPSNCQPVRTVLREVLRLHTPVLELKRLTTAPIESHDNTYSAGGVLHFPIRVIHRDPRWWTNPKQFDPDRFHREEPAHNRAYAPFGVGPRRCLGEAFAIDQAIILIATCLNRMEWVTESDPDVMRPHASGVLRDRIELSFTRLSE